MIAECDREIKMRQRVYPRQISQGKLSRSQSEYLIGCMEAIRETLTDLREVNISKAAQIDERVDGK